MSRGTPSSKSYSSKTSAMEGHSLGELEKVWEDLAASEARIRMMDKLAAFKVGFNDVENFNLGLRFNATRPIPARSCGAGVKDCRVKELDLI